MTDEYETISSFLSDVQLLLSNTRHFYGPSSEECKQVNDLEAEFTQVLSEHGLEMDSSEACSNSACSDSDSIQSPTRLTLKIPKFHFQSMQPGTTSASSSRQIRRTSLSTESTPGLKGGVQPSSKGVTKHASTAATGRGKVTRSQAWIQEYLESDDPIKVYLAAVYDYHDPSSEENVAGAFLQLPSRVLYPEYYKVITQPIDLSIIRKNTEVRGVYVVGEGSVAYPL